MNPYQHFQPPYPHSSIPQTAQYWAQPWYYPQHYIPPPSYPPQQAPLHAPPWAPTSSYLSHQALPGSTHQPVSTSSHPSQPASNQLRTYIPTSNLYSLQEQHLAALLKMFKFNEDEARELFQKLKEQQLRDLFDKMQLGDQKALIKDITKEELQLKVLENDPELFGKFIRALPQEERMDWITKLTGAQRDKVAAQYERTDKNRVE